ncbi:rhomboid family intramembrane serine protease [Acidicapsa ligni]|uniref:rhomboid family intramembrane serine protease n=1 Tax=Acidicapsa ligni TaxID=542300 RepID=UPI0021E0D6B5|nr:rhomboid family intramembrane serine protease [Acidicapsa ligni]
MPRFGSSQFAFPEFSGATRRLILINLTAYFLLLLATTAKLFDPLAVMAHFGLYPPNFMVGQIWQPLTYSFIHLSLIGTLLELLSLWFLCGFLEQMHGGQWMTRLYAASVVGAALTAIVIYEIGLHTGHPQESVALTGCLGGIFGLITAIGVLHGDLQFQMFFVIGIKAKYLAIIYALIALAETFGELRVYAFAQLGGGLAAILYVKYAPRGSRGRGIGVSLSERWYGLRNQYFRWKRRRAASKFQVYMKKQGRIVRFDGQGRLIDDDDVKHDDRTRWN